MMISRMIQKPETCLYCDKPVWSRGLCRLHDGRWRTRVPMEAPLYGYRLGNLERFWTHVDINPGGCWLWKAGSSNRGYGKFWADGNTWSAYRWLYQAVIGKVPKGLTLDHICRTRLCVNPAHLEIVSVKENVLRGIGITAVNAKKTHCKHGHLFDEQNTYLVSDGSRACRTCVRLNMRRYLGIKSEACRV